MFWLDKLISLHFKKQKIRERKIVGTAAATIATAISTNIYGYSNLLSHILSCLFNLKVEIYQPFQSTENNYQQKCS